jgi:hypothetical protein
VSKHVLISIVMGYLIIGSGFSISAAAVVSDGLVLHLDAAAQVSQSGKGTQNVLWKNLAQDKPGSLGAASLQNFKGDGTTGWVGSGTSTDPYAFRFDDRYRLSFLVIDENGVSFQDADEIKGKDAFASEDYILAKSSPGAGAMVIGHAGENRVAFACIKSDHWRSLGRGGMGAILGSKNLKGISFGGQKQCQIADEQLLKNITKNIAIKAKDLLSTKVYQTYGTPMQVAVTNSEKCFPTRHWSSGYFEKWETLSAD